MITRLLVFPDKDFTKGPSCFCPFNWQWKQRSAVTKHGHESRDVLRGKPSASPGEMLQAQFSDEVVTWKTRIYHRWLMTLNLAPWIGLTRCKRPLSIGLK
jgi:hypothetical protein